MQIPGLLNTLGETKMPANTRLTARTGVMCKYQDCVNRSTLLIGIAATVIITNMWITASLKLRNLNLL